VLSALLVKVTMTTKRRENPDEAGGFGFLDTEAPASSNTFPYKLIIIVTAVFAAGVVFFVHRRKTKITD